MNILVNLTITDFTFLIGSLMIRYIEALFVKSSLVVAVKFYIYNADPFDLL